jgi:hypothetical protein
MIGQREENQINQEKANNLSQQFICANNSQIGPALLER